MSSDDCSEVQNQIHQIWAADNGMLWHLPLISLNTCMVTGYVIQPQKALDSDRLK